MSYPPGTPDPTDPDGSRGAGDPWATPSGDQPTQPTPQPPYGAPQQPYGYGQPDYGQQPYGYPPQPGYGQQPPYGYPAPQRTNGKATAALWTGIASLVLAFCCGLGITGILPIVLGVKARGEIRATGGQQEGDGMALAGIITGAVAVVLSLVVIAVIVLALVSGDANFDGTTQTRV
ncbi:DUF4190 domain-containing protein [Nocardioides panacis]|uniref:DUF4190 domain-containing protein n=1 Tax=Nocardioides panacis TaxID=2849501 RepID=A0A975T2C2_9ACTN|nr:DUF4190 domain-containing protein [Nocardioides panacis]QWZ10277.1 DUF4190 domain-containing protein [Nocardioides panacis]